MSSFWRFTLLGSFAAAGMGLAMCVAVSSQTPADASTESSEATATVAPATPLIEQPRAPIARQSSFGPSLGSQTTLPPPAPPQSVGGPLSPNLLLAQGATTPNNGNSAVPPQTQAEVIELLRQQMQRALQAKQDGAGNLPDPASGLPDAGSARGSLIPPQSTTPSTISPAPVNTVPAKSKPRITRIPGEGDNNLAIHIQDADLRDVLEMLSEQGGLNILPSPTVQGKVSAALNGVDIDTALAAILRSTGYVARHEGKFIYVGTPQDFKSMQQAADTIGTRVYHINYVRASDIQALITPLLTPAIGSVSVTAPANEGIGADSSKAGGNQFAGGEAVLVHDFAAVLDEIDQVIAEVDRKPAQVAIEAMILRVTLKDVYSFGVDFELLRQNPTVRFATGSPLASVGDLKFNDGGLKFAYLDGSTSAFISALETIGDTNVIASPKLMVVDKARAEVLIGKQLGYVNTTITETSTAQNVQFLEVGTQLRLRPFISCDGLIRMEVHPELSDGSVEVREGLTLPQKETTQVTTNVIIPDGCTVIIGGLLQNSLKTDAQQIPLLGSLPGVGFLFRRKTETTEKEEIIVLITPHIVCEPDAACEGDKSAAEFHRRQAVYADQMSHLGKRYLGRRYYRLAQAAWAKGDQQTALRFIDLSIHFDPMSREAIELRTDIWNGNLVGDHTLLPPGMFAPVGVPILAVPEGDIPSEPPMPRSFETVPPGRPVLQDPQATAAARSGASVMREPRMITPSGNSAFEVARSSPQLAPPANRPPKLNAANELDGSRLPNWMVDNLRQNGSGPTQPAGAQ